MFGICGGFQMLGTDVQDPDGLEGEAGRTEGLGLLDMTTRMVAGKQLKDVTGTLALGRDNARFSGYEMHNGVTTGPALATPLAELDGKPDGAVSEDGQVAGTYVHGIFDQPDACRAILHWAGLEADTELADKAVNYQQHRQQQLDRLADLVEDHLDTDWLRNLLGLGKQDASKR